MILGDLIKCTDCSQNIRTHFSMAGYFPQIACFKCKKCGNDIKYGYDKNKKLVIEGAEKTDDQDDAIDATISADKPLDVYSDLPSTMQTVTLAAQMGLQKMFRFEKYEQDLNSSKESWERCNKFFRILKEKSLNDAETICSKTKETFLSEISECSSFFVSGKWKKLFADFDQLFANYKDNPVFIDLKRYIRSEYEEWLEKIYNVYESYYENELEFRKVALMQKCEHDIFPSKIHCHWNKIKKVYADIYEVVCAMFILPTAISNLESGRDWNVFQSADFTWEKYLQTDMDGRGKNFELNDKLKNLLLGHDNRLRNAPSHAASKFDCTKSEIIMKCGKGGNRTEIVSLVDYMKKTNDIFAVFQCMVEKFLKMILM